jgi:hypothetical protein
MFKSRGTIGVEVIPVELVQKGGGNSSLPGGEQNYFFLDYFGYVRIHNFN